MRFTGVVKWYDNSKGFGFITLVDGSRDIFVHVSSLEMANLKALREGQTIQFEIQKDPRRNRESAIFLHIA